MTITRHFIDHTAFHRNLIIPDDLRDWLLVEYGVEPYDGFWDEIVLEELVVMHCEAYHCGMIDTTIPRPAELWKSRYNSLHDLFEDTMDELRSYQDEYARLMDKLKEAGITID